MSVLLPAGLLPAKVLSLSVVSLASAVLGGSLAGAAFTTEEAPPPPARAAAENRRAPLPPGSTTPGAAGVEATAVRLAHALDAVPVREGGDEQERFCPVDRLRVRWSAPVDGEFSVGGHVAPVGPAPADGTTEVNGLVVCDGASHAYMGFEARWDGRAWSVAAVPSLSDEHDLHEEAAHEEASHEEPSHEEPSHGEPSHEEAAHQQPAHEDHDSAEEHAPEAAPAPAPRRPAPGVRGFTVPSVKGIDAYPSYDPQRVCDPVGKPGMLALRDVLLRTYPGTRSLGVSRTCTARGVSEHKEGRAFDWGVRTWVPSERAAAASALSQLLATDSAGNRHALARRLGVMYVIWDSRIWSAYSADRGWRTYGGANPHTDHVHVSLSWAGAMGRTSYWQGDNARLLAFDPELRLVDGTAPGVPTRTGGTTTTTTGQDERASRRREDEPDEARPERLGRPGREGVREDRDEVEEPRDEAAHAERRAQRDARKAAQRAEREARKAQQAEREARKVAEQEQAEQEQAARVQAAAQAEQARAQAAGAAAATRASERAAAKAVKAAERTAAQAAKAKAKAAAGAAAKATRAEARAKAKAAAKAQGTSRARPPRGGADRQKGTGTTARAPEAGGERSGKSKGKGKGKGRD